MHLHNRRPIYIHVTYALMSVAGLVDVHTYT